MSALTEFGTVTMFHKHCKTCTKDVIVSSHDTFNDNTMQELNTTIYLKNRAMKLETILIILL